MIDMIDKDAIHAPLFSHRQPARPQRRCQSAWGQKTHHTKPNTPDGKAYLNQVENKLNRYAAVDNGLTSDRTLLYGRRVISPRG